MGGLDFGGLSALAGVNPWQEIREERQKDSQRIAIMNAMAQQQNQKQQASAEEIQNHLNTIGQIKTLDEDHARIQAKEKELSATIQDGIRAAHGNVAKYLETGGRTALNQYQNTLLESDEVQQGLRNSVMHNMATSAKMGGQTLMPTSWKNEKTGKTEQGEYAENYAAYKRGDTHELNFAGAYKSPDIGDLQEEFSKLPGPETPDGSGAPVTASDIKQKALIRGQSKGLGQDESEHNANRVAQQYQNAVNSGQIQPYRYKGTVEEKAKKVAMLTSIGRLELARQKQEEKLKNSGSFSGDVLGKITTPAEQNGYALPMVMPEANVHSYMEQFGTKPDASVPADAKKPITAYGTTFPDKVIKDSFAKSKLGGLQFHKAKKGEDYDGWVGKVVNGDRAISATTLQQYPGNINDYPGYVKDILGTVSLPSPDGRGNKLYAKITYHFDNQQDMGQGGWFGLSGGFGASNSHKFWPDSPTGASQGDISGSKHDLTMLVPVNYGKDEHGRDIDPLGSQQFNFDLHNKAAQKYATQDDEFMAGATLDESEPE